jgi:hypothetical protein
MCIYSLSYPACKAHAPYCHLWSLRPYHIFPSWSRRQQDFREKVTENKMCVLTFSTTFVWKSLIIRRIERDVIISVLTCSCKVPVIFSGIFKLPGQIFKKCWTTKFHENPFSESRVIPCRRRNRQTDMTRQMAAFRSFANAPKKPTCFVILCVAVPLMLLTILPEMKLTEVWCRRFVFYVM